MSMLHDSALATILYRMEHSFHEQSLSSQKSITENGDNLLHDSSSNNVLSNISLSNDIIDDLDRYLLNSDQLSDESHASTPSISSSSAPLTHQSSSSQFEFILNALTSSSARINEETTTYLNQGQPYEIKFQANINSFSENKSSPTTYRSILRLCFWDKTLQNQERELMQKWLNEQQLSSLFDIDTNLTYGILSIICSTQIPNAVEIVWDTSTTTSLFIRFKCTSTDFANKRHGGEKGIPLRIQIDTYHENGIDNVKHLHACCCKIQLFRLKGAQRKNKADKLRIDKLNHDQRRRYQTTLEYTILQSCNASPLYTLDLLSLSYPPDDLSDVYTLSTENDSVEKKDYDNIQKKLNDNYEFLSTPSPDVKYIGLDLSKEKEDIETKLSIRSSNEDVLKWLKTYNFSSVLNRFQHYTGMDLFRLTTNDLRRICNDDDSISIRLYNQLHEIIVPPLKTFYIKTANNDIYSVIYLHALTRRELVEKLFELTHQETCNLILELNQIKIKIDNDNVVKYSLPNDGQFYLKILPYEFILCLINNTSV
ncbi:unnamed protein product [Adineta steineri]|uniref:Grh/CP2 DB domain-containing protein n=1 Tax=Adineta steineri TaxID=433720 RepID=A0A813RN50_9BILA|nr:unnamed protein product [Adineta steineri]CAF3554588.1 unnamed protein product [Adineta steineri]